MSNINRPVLRYHGGKFLLAPWILSHFPGHKVYVELFGGAGSVLMQKKRSYAEIYNDKWDLIVNVFEILRDPEKATRLEQLIRMTPFSRTEFNKCGQDSINKIKDPMEKARLTIFRSFAGFGSASVNGEHATGFRATSRRAGTTPAHDWSNYPDNLKSFVKRLVGVVIENKDYEYLITQHDASDTLFYADPPYVRSTRNIRRGNASYKIDMDDDDHRTLLARLDQVKGMVVLSGYDNDLYTCLEEKGWKVFRKQAKADSTKNRTECLWLNAPAYRAIAKKLFD